MLRILFFGMSGRFSSVSMEYLLAHDVKISGVIMPTDSKPISEAPQQLKPPAAEPTDGVLFIQPVHPTILHSAWQHNIPIWTVSRLSNPATRTLLTDLSPDLICVACFPYIFPPWLLDLPQFGCLNLHPSLLPAYRGPTPIFWICRNGERETGVTLHYLDQGIDSGDVVAQAQFSLLDGLTETAITDLSASYGAKLLLKAIQALPHNRLPRYSQSEADSSYYPSPSSKDMIISTSWSAQRAFNFLRGADSWPLAIRLNAGYLLVSETLGYDRHSELTGQYATEDGLYLVQFFPGILKISGTIQPTL